MLGRILSGWLAVAFPLSALAAQANWENDLREMGYMFLHISNINVVNGLNLTREQAGRLMQLAAQVEEAAPPPPSLRGPIAPELAEVRKAWLELRALLLKGEPVPKELEDRVNRGRMAESKVIRSTLRSVPAAINTNCVSCHTAPGTASGTPMSPGPGTKKIADLAHVEGIYGRKGIAKLVQLSPKVEEVLTEAQEAILGGFACCLVPPQSLSDPVRAGQAESSEKVLDLLRRVRACPEAFWPTMREGILAYADQFTEAVSPGASPLRRAAARDGVAKALDRARACSDVEFELEKDNLSKAVKTAIVPAPGEGPYKAAYFLLIPGASRVYANYLKRLAAK
ncbi:MAG: hypothetical protein FJ291_23775 [Planctomycetes bacterium]|nr:hypothetical protein [Planctomycetota bacterium]